MAIAENNHKIAVLIDYDNFNNEEFLKVLFEELNEYGDIIIKEAYFSDLDSTITNKNKATKHKFIEKLQTLGINPKLQIPYTKGKNAADIRIAIEAMDLLNKDYITCFCFVLSDTDLTPLATKLKNENKFVIGAGIESTPKPFKVECNYFINIDTRIKDTKELANKLEKEVEKVTNKKDDRIEELVKVVNSIINENKDENGEVQFSLAIALLKKRQTDFSPKNYGFKNNSALPFFHASLNNYYKIDKRSGVDFISIKKNDTSKQ